MSPLATPKFSIVNFQLSIGSHRLPDKRKLTYISYLVSGIWFSPLKPLFFGKFHRESPHIF